MSINEELEVYRELASYFCHNDDNCVGMYSVHHCGNMGKYYYTQVQVSLSHKQHRLAAYRKDAKDAGFVFSYNKEEIEQMRALSDFPFPTIVPTDRWELLSAGYFKKLLRLYLFVHGRY